MTMLARLVSLLALPVLAALAGCAEAPVDSAAPIAAETQSQPDLLASQEHRSAVKADAVAQLAQEIRALGSGVDPEEADRAARIAYRHTDELAAQYQITDGPLIHNIKVNMGLKPRGLCWHWAHDMEKRLKQENFRTLDLHRAIANAENVALEHSTTIISRKGDTMYEGIVLDPWRKGGKLTWKRTLDDARYKWKPRDEVLAKKLGEAEAARLLTSSAS